MDLKDAIRTFGLNIVCLALIIISVIGIKKDFDSTLLLSIFVVMLIVAAIVGIYGNIKMFSKKDVCEEEENDEKRLLSQINSYMSNGCQETMLAASCMNRQIQNFDKRKKVLLGLLNEYFSDDDNLGSYTSLIEHAQKSLIENIELGLKRISIFDSNEYIALVRHQGNYSAQTYESKMNQYKEHIKYINNLVDTNDRMLIEFDNLITEVSRLNESDDANDLSVITDTVNAMKQLHFSEDRELDGLKTKY